MSSFTLAVQVHESAWLREGTSVKTVNMWPLPHKIMHILNRSSNVSMYVLTIALHSLPSLMLQWCYQYLIKIAWNNLPFHKLDCQSCVHENQPGTFQNNCMHYEHNIQVSMLSVIAGFFNWIMKATYCLLHWLVQLSQTCRLWTVQSLVSFPKVHAGTLPPWYSLLSFPPDPMLTCSLHLNTIQWGTETIKCQGK